MSKVRKIIGFLAVLAISGCAKEYSFENPLSGPITTTVGNNCFITKIVDKDTISGKNVYAHQATLNTTGNYPIAIAETDSLTGQTTFAKALTLIGDTLRVDANAYFLVDLANNYRVRLYYGPENPYSNGATQVKYNYQFIYDQNDRVIRKIVTNPQFPGTTVSQTDYVYNTDSSLIQVRVTAPITSVVYQECDITYHATQKAKNYLYMFADCGELRPYMQMLNFGVRPKYAPIKVDTKIRDQITGVVQSTIQTQFLKYQYSADGYVITVDAVGFNIPALGLNNSRNVFSYTCK